jgi:hypothetical protein
VVVFAGRDPITGKRLYLSESTTDLALARKVRAKFRAQVAEQRSVRRTKATFRHAIGEWLKVHEIEDTTRQSYEMYLRLYIGPALGEMRSVRCLSARFLPGSLNSSTRSYVGAAGYVTENRLSSTGRMGGMSASW